MGDKIQSLLHGCVWNMKPVISHHMPCDECTHVYAAFLYLSSLSSSYSKPFPNRNWLYLKLTGAPYLETGHIQSLYAF